MMVSVFWAWDRPGASGIDWAAALVIGVPAAAALAMGLGRSRGATPP